jgi:hypothetical protein
MMKRFPTNAGVVNDLPKLWFVGCVVKGVITFRYTRISGCRAVIQRSADNVEFRMLVVHRSFYVSMAHCPHDGG